MSEVPATLRYTESHEWVKDNGDGTATIGITAHAQEVLGDVVFVELPDEGKEISRGEDFALVESVKAASDVYSPISGEITAANRDLEGAAELINESPYENGWIATMKMSDASELEQLLDAAAYEKLLAEEEH